jgi:hypothetical protein
VVQNIPTKVKKKQKGKKISEERLKERSHK